MTADQKFTKEAAIALAETKWWETKTAREIAEFQMTQELMCCPFDVFHGALEKTLGRSIWTHEFGLDWHGLKAELMGNRPKPSFNEILNLIPKDKLTVVAYVPSTDEASAET